uniref:Uncharacterized protein n=1 Tax=Arundo donax TaxID=35708 RepID=A0A0A9CUB8_ARUDO
MVHNFSLSNVFMQQDRHVIRNNITIPMTSHFSLGIRTENDDVSCILMTSHV